MFKYRDWLNKNSAVVTIGAVVALIASLFYIISLTGSKKVGPPPAPKQYYFYDMTSEAPNPLDRLFPAPSSEFPPTEVPSGKEWHGSPAGVKA